MNMQEVALEVESNFGATKKLRGKSRHEEGEKRKKRKLGPTSLDSKQMIIRLMKCLSLLKVCI